jgi:ribosome biogenesis GTPase
MWYTIENKSGNFVKGRLRGKLKLKGTKTTNPIAVGDYVLYDMEDEQTAVIHSVEERMNYIIRQSPKKTAHAHIIAANIDQAILLATLSLPRTSLGFIDRFLVAAESFRIPAGVVFNKRDLLGPNELDYVKELMELYQSLGYKTASISALDSDDLVQVENLLDKKTSLISGHSGVGKSTLLNMLHPQVNQKTAEVSTFANKGVHTTTFAEMFELGKDTFIIDTPGIKELGLMDMETWEISHYFPEMREFLNECRYHNCLHISENNCAIKNAVMDGEIAESRYLSYLSMVEGEDNRR